MAWAKGSERKMRAFLSFATEDAGTADEFRRLVQLQHPHVELVDHAVGDNYEPNWKAQCEQKIRSAAILVCLLGPSTYRSAPVAWEIDRALALGKRVIAVNPTGGALQLPEVLSRHSIEARSPTKAKAECIRITDTMALVDREVDAAY